MPCIAQPVTAVAGEGSEAEEVVEVVGGGGVLAVQDADVGEVQQVAGDLDRLAAGVAGGEQVRRLVGDRDLDVAGRAGQAQVGVERGDGVDAEPELLPRLVPHHQPWRSRLGTREAAAVVRRPRR